MGNSVQPGDKVRVLRDGYDAEDIYIIVSVTANSVGEIISFAEYCDHILGLDRGNKESDLVKRYLLDVEKGIELGNFLPVRITEFAPLSDDVYDFWANQGYRRGEVNFWPERITLIDTGSIEKID